MVVFWYRTRSVHGLNGIGEPKVRVCFVIGSGGTWINSDTKTSTSRHVAVLVLLVLVSELIQTRYQNTLVPLVLRTV